MKHVVFFSGGLGSFLTAWHVLREHEAVLLFTDTKTEDEDLYRFISDCNDRLHPITTIADGRDVWEVMRDVRLIGNTQQDPCSRVLKRELAKKWVKKHCPDPTKTILYIGIDWTEIHRRKQVEQNWSPYSVSFPLIDCQYADRNTEAKNILADLGIKPPRLYRMGFHHNNCGGFCIKAGHGQFAVLLQNMPERYAYHEKKEKEMQEYLGTERTILRDRRGGKTKPLSLEKFRLRYQSKDRKSLDLDDFGGCGCFL